MKSIFRIILRTQFVIALLCAMLFSFESLYALIDILTISGNPPPLVISTATAGQQPNSATDATTSYGLTNVDLITKRITGQINIAMPANVTLRVQLQAPSGATSSGSVAMTTVAQNLVTAIPILGIAAGLTITYQLSATVNAAQTAGAVRTLTLTIL